MPRINKIANDAIETALPDHRDFDLFNFSPVPMWVYDPHSLKILAANDSAQQDYGYTLKEFLDLTVDQLWPEEDLPVMMTLMEEKIKQGLQIKSTIRLIKKDGSIIFVDVVSKPVPSWGENSRIVIAVDVTVSKRLHELESHEKEVLALNSKPEVPLNEVLAYYVKGIESLFPQMHCTIMQVKHNHIYKLVASSMPKAYLDEIEGRQIGADAGSCGTAAFLKQTVIVSDICNDNRWKSYKQLALSFNLCACWSQPIINSAGEVMATFAIYYNKVNEPNEDELKVIERASSILKVVLENRQYAETLRESNLRLRDIAWAQTHLVRAPLARILGIIELLQREEGGSIDKQLMDYLSISANELDEVIKNIIHKSLND